jgi:hypothetical protein
MGASDSVQLRCYRAALPFALSAGDEAGENSSVSPTAIHDFHALWRFADVSPSAKVRFCRFREEWMATQDLRGFDFDSAGRGQEDNNALHRRSSSYGWIRRDGCSSDG